VIHLIFLWSLFSSPSKEIPCWKRETPFVNPTLTGLIVFACVLGGVLLGMAIRLALPEHHLNDDSKDVIKLGMGLIATLSALVLGLVIASAKSSYDTQNGAVKNVAVKILLLDRALGDYGPEAKETRDLLRTTLTRKIDELWPADKSKPASLTLPEPTPSAERIERSIRQLAPRDDFQRGLHSRALELANDIMETRWFVSAGRESSVPAPFLVVVSFWLSFLFGCFGIFAPRNGTVVAILFVCALSIGGSIFLILEMDQPFSGVMKVSSSPLRYTLSHLGQ
jgi:hypothetical protein